MKSLTKLRERRVPSEDRLTHIFEAKKAAIANESYEWLVEATQPIEQKYTNETFAQGDRIKSQLNDNLAAEFFSEFEYQGSVTNDTHVKFHSDIDLLVLHGVYTTYPPGHLISNPVSSEVVADALLDLRAASVRILKAKFPAAEVDNTGSKAIAVSGGSLTRDVDVVICNWWHTPEYLQNHVRANLGIKVLDTATKDRIGNKPFLHNWHINQKDTNVGGGLRKASRLLKNLKYDKQPTAAISSYDIAALAWNMPEADLKVRPGAYLQLAQNTSKYLNRLLDDSTLRDSLYVPNGTRKVFTDGSATLASLRELTTELDDLLGDISIVDQYLISLDEATEGFEKSASWQEARASRVREALSKFARAD